MTRAIQNRVKPTTVSRTARSRSVVPRKAARSSAASVTPSSRGEQGVQANPGSTCCHSKDSSENGSEPLCNRRPSSFTPKDTDPMNLTSEPDIKFQPASFKPKAGTKTGKPATITAPCVIGTTEANENSTKGQGIVVTAEEKPTLSIRTAGLKIRKEYIAVANDMPLIKQTKGTTVHNQLAKQIMTTDKKSKATGNPVAITTPYESISENGPAESTSKNSKNAVGFSASNSRKEISTNSYFFSESPESSVNSLYNAADYVRSKPTSLLPFIASPSTEIISPRSAGARPRQAFSPFGCPQANLITNNYPGSLHAPVVCPQSWAPYSQDCPHGYQLLSQYGAGTYQV
ncbi:hypothetical protein BJ742DRAFT_869922, partial [Cladochytrium replicatum]